MSTAELADLVRRLEDVTQKLEKNADAGAGFAKSAAPVKKHPVVQAPAAPSPAAGGSVTRRGPPPPRAPTAGSTASNSLEAFDELINVTLPMVVSPSTHIGGRVQEVTQIIENAFRAERDIVEALSKCKQPEPRHLQALVEPCSNYMVEACDMAAAKPDDATPHCKAAAEALQGLAWVVSGPGSGMPLPPVHVMAMWECAEPYCNKVLMQHRNGGNPHHVEWAKAVSELFAGLAAYVRRWHPGGPAWTPSGICLSTFKPSKPEPKMLRSTSSKLGARSGPPPPPPPPPPTLDALFEKHEAKAGAAGAKKKPAAASGNMGALLQQINKGDGVTSGLRHVTKEMRKAAPTGPRPTPHAARPSSPSHKVATTPKKKPPRFELEDKHWFVENIVDRDDLVIEGGAMNHAVHVTNCTGSVLQVKNKVNAIMMDNCSKCGIVFDSLVSSMDVINCKKVQIQCTGSVPTIAIDKTDNIQVFLSQSALEADVVTAKSSEVNITVPGASPDDDMVEHALPEQFISKWDGKGFKTMPVVHRNG